MPDAPPPPIEDLLAAEARLDRSFGVAVVAFLMKSAWPAYLQLTRQQAVQWVGAVEAALFVGMVVTYLWFAHAATAAAGRVGRSRVLVGGWILLAPVCAFLPIPVVTKLIEASPLSLKFILSSEIRSVIHERTFAE
jgi:hypothetical protein